MKKNISKQPLNFYSVMGIIGDWLMIPVMLLALISSVFMLASRSNNKVPAVFGVSMVRISSNSMLNDGYKVGDVVFISQKNKTDIKVGDIVAFYYAGRDMSKNQNNLVDIQEVVSCTDTSITYVQDSQNVTINRNANFNKEEQTKIKEKNPVLFHYVTGIFVDENGVVYYQTQGAGATPSGQLPEMFYSREDFIVGKYSNTPVWLRDIISFCGSALGMILIVCMPLCVLIFIQSLSLIEQCSIIIIEKKLMSGELKFTDHEANDGFNGNVIESANKVYLYYTAVPEDRPKLKQYLWSDILTYGNLNWEQEKERRAVTKMDALLKAGKNVAYWKLFIDIKKGREKRILQTMQEELAVKDLIKEVEISEPKTRTRLRSKVQTESKTKIPSPPKPPRPPKPINSNI